jgi:pyruvate dehydrogenase E1 component alpha subunit
MKSGEKIKLYRDMVLIRRFEEKAAEMYTFGKVGGFCHLYIGQEANAVGALSVMRDDDYIITAYRDHGHAIARGSDPKAVMAELFGKQTGVCKGKGGSMHLVDVKKNFLGGYAIVGGHIPLATGVGFAIKYRSEDKVVLCFFGEGAVNAGVFHESFNLATLWKLPVIYICENNRYAMGTPVERGTSLYDVSRKACAYDMPSEHIDGMDIMKVRETVKKAVQKARRDSTPTFIESRTYRFMGHSMSDPSHGHYRTKEELEIQKKRDPIQLYKMKLKEEGILHDDIVKDIDREVESVVEEAVSYAEKSPFPNENEALQDLYI